MNDARSVANFFLARSQRLGRPITILSLLKILYFAHAWYLAKMNRPLVAQPFSAWKHGPVCEVVYDQFRDYGQKYIDKYCVSFNINDGKFSVSKYEFDEETEKFLCNIFDYYSQFHPYKLSDLTHEKGGPWDLVWTDAENNAIPGMKIKNESIMEWFRKGGGEANLAAFKRRPI
ncbi:MAG: Panacea domain-containing protein [Beijerinckiaceae bacterium]